MIRTVDLRGRALSKAQYNLELPRATLNVAQAMVLIQPILDRVKNGTEADLIALAQEFDGIAPASIRVPQLALDEALSQLDPAIRTALELSIERVKKVHNDQLRSEKTTTVVDGGTVTEKWVPVDRVGLYVPGGRAVYPSSVMMNVIPAQIAQVQSIAVASPPQKEFGGLPHPTILATCALLGITEVYAVGGAQAIALFAYLISQAEHDVIAAAVLVTDSPELAKDVAAELKVRVEATKHSDRIKTALSGVQSAIVLVDDINQGLDVVNAYAAEHLEIQTRNARSDAAKIRNAGAVFIGRFSPVSLGDYSAGSNHVLPTGGCACHSSGLSVQTFLRGLHFIEYGQEAFTQVIETVVTLANAEDLPAHGEAMTARLENL